MGGIPIATALSLTTGSQVLFVRKEAKEYGTYKLAEGGDIDGKNLVIIEDVVTSGGAIMDAVKELRARGAIVKHVLCVIDRESTGRENLEALDLEFTPLFTKSRATAYKQLMENHLFPKGVIPSSLTLFLRQTDFRLFLLKEVHTQVS